MKIEIEFYDDKTGTIEKGIQLKWNGQDWKKFDDLDGLQIEMIFDRVAKYKRAWLAFMHLAQFDDFRGNHRETLRQFIHCNWTKLDNKLDIADHKLIFENVPCPFKSSGKCLINGKGIVCIKH